MGPVVTDTNATVEKEKKTWRRREKWMGTREIEQTNDLFFFLLFLLSREERQRCRCSNAMMTCAGTVVEIVVEALGGNRRVEMDWLGM